MYHMTSVKCNVPHEKLNEGWTPHFGRRGERKCTKKKKKKTTSTTPEHLSELCKVDRGTRHVHLPVLIHFCVLGGRLNARLLIRLDLLTAQTERVIGDPYDALWAARSWLRKPIILCTVWPARKERIVIVNTRSMLGV